MGALGPAPGCHQRWCTCRPRPAPPGPSGLSRSPCCRLASSSLLGLRLRSCLGGRSLYRGCLDRGCLDRGSLGGGSLVRRELRRRRLREPPRPGPQPSAQLPAVPPALPTGPPPSGSRWHRRTSTPKAASRAPVSGSPTDPRPRATRAARPAGSPASSGTSVCRCRYRRGALPGCPQPGASCHWSSLIVACRVRCRSADPVTRTAPTWQLPQIAQDRHTGLR